MGQPVPQPLQLRPGFPLEEWAPTFEAGLVERAQSTGPGVTFTVTPLGYAVVAVRLRAEIVNADLQPKEGR